jgi:hypothetical protein
MTARSDPQFGELTDFNPSLTVDQTGAGPIRGANRGRIHRLDRAQYTFNLSDGLSCSYVSGPALGFGESDYAAENTPFLVPVAWMMSATAPRAWGHEG